MAFGGTGGSGLMPATMPPAAAPTMAPQPEMMPTDAAAPPDNTPVPEQGQDAAPQDPRENPLFKKLMRWSNPLETKNIALEVPADVRAKIGMRVKMDYDIDLLSRTDWLKRSKAAIDLAMQVSKTKTSPWENCSNIIYPLMTTAAIQFNARSYPAFVNGRQVVKGVVVGSDEGTAQRDPETGQPVVDPETGQPVVVTPPGAKRKRSENIANHMSWQLLEEQCEWEDETDKLLLILPIVGCAFRKTYFSPVHGRNMSVLVRAEKLVVNYWAKNIDTAPRISEEVEFYPNEVIEMVRAGLFIEQDYKSLSGGRADDGDAPIEFIEQHRLWDLDGDGYEEPYIVTVLKSGGQVARIAAAYEAEGIKIAPDAKGEHKIARIQKEYYYTKYGFFPNPDGGFYDVGFGQLLTPINDTVNTIINMLLDAGTLQNTGGGFIGRGFSVHTGSLKLKLGEWKFVNAPGGAIRDAIVPMQYAGPSQTLMALLGTMVEAGKEIASVKDVLTGGEAGTANMQPTTLLALIEQGLKVFTAITKRVHRSAKREYDKLFRLNQIYLEEQTGYPHGDEWKEITRDDYMQGGGVVPASDPTMVSDMQRMGQAQFLQGYQNDPYCDPIEIRRRIFEAAKSADPDKLLAKQQAPNPEVIAKAAKLEIDGQRAKTQSIKDMAQAVLYIAQADAAGGNQDIAWENNQLTALKMLVSGEIAPGGAGGQQGGPEEELPEPELIGNGEGGEATGEAPEIEADDEEPPVEGARLAPDGAWYVSDPNREGKYLKVEA